MAALSTARPNLLDLTKTMDPDGSIAAVGEILNETNEVIPDVVWQEGNLPTGHRSAQRVHLPAAAYRKLYGYTQPTKGTVVTVTDSCAQIVKYSEVDKVLADLGGNAAAFRSVEDMAAIEAMSQKFVDGLFYGNAGLAPEEFTGLSPRYNLTSAANGENIILGGGSDTDNGSIWLIVWSPETICGIYPKGMKAGLEVQDKGQITLQSTDGYMEAYQTFYSWHVGLHVKDWRFAVRIPNIDKSLLTKDASTGANLPDLMFRAMRRIPNLSKGRAAFYMSRDMATMLGQQSAQLTSSSTLQAENVGGMFVESFNKIPVRRVDALASDEALVS